MGEFRMPSLGADMEEGTLVEWLVHPGDVVHRGDVVAVVDTVKTAMDVEVFEDGTVERLLVEPGTTLPVGAPMAVIAGTTTAAAAAAAGAPPPVVPTAPAAPRHPDSPLVRHRARQHPAPVPPRRPAPERSRVRAAPRVRRRAAELGVDLSTVEGTRPGGVVGLADLERVAATPAPQPPERAAPTPTQQPPDRADRRAAQQAAVGQLMARSKRDIPHYYLSTTIDLHAATAWLAAQNAGRPADERLVPAALLLKATALAARKVPEVNGFWTDGAFRPSEPVHLGVAISLRGGGLVAPAIHDAESLPVEDVMARLRDLVSRARAGRLRQSEMADPTITVTNLGELGCSAVFGVIYPPQVALVGFGRIEERPRAVDGMLAVRSVVDATLSADHRVSDGHRGARFLNVLDALLQQPESL
jgi:pyruvate dehydrogenase E2 component (dihydrolipoamide acetyltransferase)